MRCAPACPGAPDWVFEIPLVGQTLGDLWNRWAADISVMVEALRPYFGIVLEGGLGLLLGLANGVLLFVLALFIAFFFYLYGEPIAARLRVILQRIAGARAERLIDVTGATVRGVVYGILLTAIVQGILTAFGLWLSGVPRPVLLGAVAGFLSVLPIGAPVVWIPAALWLMGSGHLGWGIFLAVYGVVAVSGADSVIRPWFIARGAQLPFLLTVLGVLGGAIAFGLLGIFLGPVLLGIGYTLVNEWAGTERESAVDRSLRETVVSERGPSEQKPCRALVGLAAIVALVVAVLFIMHRLNRAGRRFRTASRPGGRTARRSKPGVRTGTRTLALRADRKRVYPMSSRLNCSASSS